VETDAMHALVIEDEPLIAMLIEDELRAIGYSSVAFAVTEIEAMEAAQDHVPDMITSDVRLAEGCGISAVEAICRSGKVPVAFITGLVD
jgi:CheY-like chemotaxis protein